MWMVDKMRKSTIEYAKLDNIIAEHGEDWLRLQIITRIADGDDPKSIAHSFGVHHVYLRKWLEEHAGEDVSLALRARADCLEHEATEAVNAADPDTVAVARLESDYKLKLCERFDKKKYGIKEVQETGGSGLALPQFIISFISNSPQPHHEKIVIEHEKERLIIESE